MYRNINILKIHTDFHNKRQSFNLIYFAGPQGVRIFNTGEKFRTP